MFEFDMLISGTKTVYIKAEREARDKMCKINMDHLLGRDTSSFEFENCELVYTRESK